MNRALGYFVWMSCVTLVLVAGCNNNGVTEDAPATPEDVAPKITPDVFSEAMDHQQASGVYTIVEEMPTLVGGLAAVRDVLEYPASARDAGVEGRVLVSFTVNVEGKPVDLRVVVSVNEALDEAAINAVEQQQFTIGRRGGKPVPVRMSLPVPFKLQQ